jgi:hypothetical protein
MKPLYLKKSKAELIYISSDMKSLIEVYIDDDFRDDYLDESLKSDIRNGFFTAYFVREYDISNGNCVYKDGLGGILDITPELALEVYLSNYKTV